MVMKWPHRKRADAGPTEGEKEARQALHAAEERVQQAKEDAPEVTTVVHTLKRYGERNNFTAMIRKALQKEGHPT
jgi:hypothetical protein